MVTLGLKPTASATLLIPECRTGS